MTVEWFRDRPGRAAFADQLALEIIIRTRAYRVEPTTTILGNCTAEVAQPEPDVLVEEVKFLEKLIRSGATDLDGDEYIKTLALARRADWLACQWDDKERWPEVHALRDYLVEIGRLPCGPGFKELRALMEHR